MLNTILFFLIGVYLAYAADRRNTHEVFVGFVIIVFLVLSKLGILI